VGDYHYGSRYLPRTIDVAGNALLGFIINRGFLHLPRAIDRAVDLLSQAAVPVMLLNLGFQLLRTALQSHSSSLLLATVTRLVVAPLVAILLTTLFGLSGLPQLVVIVQAAMPTAFITPVWRWP
jgi:hypothetical protein